MGGVGSGEEKSSALCFQMGIGEDGEEGLSTCGHSGPVNERRFHSHRHGAVSCHLALTNPFPTTGNKPFPPVKYSSPSLPSSVAFFKKVSFSWGISSFSTHWYNSWPTSPQLTLTTAVFMLITCLSYFPVQARHPWPQPNPRAWLWNSIFSGFLVSGSSTIILLPPSVTSEAFLHPPFSTLTLPNLQPVSKS